MLTVDRTIRRDTIKQREAFLRVRNAETTYATQLRKIAQHVRMIIKGHDINDPTALHDTTEMLNRYAGAIGPWARTTARRMIAEVARRDELAWAAIAKTMARALRQEIQSAPTGQLLRGYLDEQVHLITSLPLEAAQRVHEMTLAGQLTGERAGTIAQRILNIGDVTASRARLIARTEVGRTASGLTQARATYVGSEGYTWRTVHDHDVRPSHRKMEGKYVRWDSPPTLDGLTGHAGALPNCRCYPEPIVPDIID